MGALVLRLPAVDVKGTVIACLVAFLAGLTLGGLLHTNGAATRKAFQDSLALDRKDAALHDALDARQRLEDSLSLRRADTIYVRALRASQASGDTLLAHLPSIPDTVRVLDSAGVVTLRQQIAAESLATVRHLHDDAVAQRATDSLVGLLRGQVVFWQAQTDTLRLARDRAIRQLAEAIPKIGGHSRLVDVAEFVGGVVVGHFVR